jgi:hypothetical protein
MPPAAAALVPHPPLLVPELAGGAAAELGPLRAACRQALDAVIAASGTVVLVGDGPVWGRPEPTAAGSFRPYGVDVEVTLPALVDVDLPGLPAPARLADLPLSLAVAAHLIAGLDRPPAGVLAAAVPATLGPRAAAAIGRSLIAAATTATASTAPGGSLAPAQAAPGGPRAAVPAGAGGSGAIDPAGPSGSDAADPAGAEGSIAAAPAGGGGPMHGGAGAVPQRPVGLVVMGDLSACRTERAPGGFRPEAAAFDGSVVEAIRNGRPERLLDLDPALAAELLVAGRVPLQVLAGALEDGPAMHGQVLYEDAPYGVGYLVALLTQP